MPEVTVYSSTADGRVRKGGSGWAATRGAGAGDAYYAAEGSQEEAARACYIGSYYYLGRSFFYFDLSTIPTGSVITNVVLHLCSQGTFESGVSAQEGIQGDTLAAADFDAFAGSKFGSVGTSPTGDGDYFDIPFNAAGISFIQGKIGTTAKICCREDAHDYDNVAPTGGNKNGCYYADYTGTSRDPKLVITYDEVVTTLTCAVDQKPLTTDIDLDKQLIEALQKPLATDIFPESQQIGALQMPIPAVQPQSIDITQVFLPLVVDAESQSVETRQKPLATDILPESQKIGALQLPIPTFQPQSIGITARPLTTDIDLDKQLIGALQKPLATDIDVLRQIIALVQASPVISSIETWLEHSAQFTSRPIVIMEITLDDGVRRYAVADTEFDGLLYEGRILQFGTIHRAISDTDGYFEISDVTTRFANTDGCFSSPGNKKYLNREVRYRVGFAGTSLAAFMTVFRGVIANYKFAGTAFELTIKSIAYKWFTKDYGHDLKAADWPFAGSGVAGTKMPVLYGDLTGHI